MGEDEFKQEESIKKRQRSKVESLERWADQVKKNEKKWFEREEKQEARKGVRLKEKGVIKSQL